MDLKYHSAHSITWIRHWIRVICTELNTVIAVQKKKASQKYIYEKEKA